MQQEDPSMPYQVQKEYRLLGEKLIGVIPNFQSLRTLRTFIKTLCRDIIELRVKFIKKHQENDMQFLLECS